MPKQPLQVAESGSNFLIVEAWYTEDGAPLSGMFTLTAQNQSGDWVDVVVDHEARGGYYPGSTTTGHILDRARGGFTEVLRVYKKQNFVEGYDTPCKITRWRPGVFGVPGNGGGDVTFRVPDTAVDVLISVKVNN